MAITDVNLFLWPHITRLSSSPSSAALDAAEEHYAMVFPIPKTGTLKKIGWRTGSTFIAMGYNVYIAVETVADAVGVPVATTRAGATLYTAGAESAVISSGLAASTTVFTPINGSTGISVTRGDMVAVTIRLTAISSGSMQVIGNQNGSFNYPFDLSSVYGNNYSYYYSGSAALWYPGMITLEYDGEFVPVPFHTPAGDGATSVAWDSGSNPDRRGMKFRFTDCDHRLNGANISVDADSDVDVILYDSDEYTVMSGFPLTIDKDKRRASSYSGFYIPFPTRPTLVKDSWYRIVLLPKDATTIINYYFTPSNDVTILGMTAFHEGSNVAYTTFNGVPTSGSHAWTDTATIKVNFGVMVDGLNLGSSSGGIWMPRARQIGV